MRQKLIDAMTVPELLEQYRDHLLLQWEFRDYHGANGKPDVGPWNRLARKIERFHRALKSRGDEGVDAILTLIHHPNRNVRHSAVVHCLKQRTDIVLPELILEQSMPDWMPMSFNFWLAHMWWTNGQWTVD